MQGNNRLISLYEKPRYNLILLISYQLYKMPNSNVCKWKIQDFKQKLDEIFTPVLRRYVHFYINIHELKGVLEYKYPIISPKLIGFVTLHISGKFPFQPYMVYGGYHGWVLRTKRAQTNKQTHSTQILKERDVNRYIQINIDFLVFINF